MLDPLHDMSDERRQRERVKKDYSLKALMRKVEMLERLMEARGGMAPNRYFFGSSRAYVYGGVVCIQDGEIEAQGGPG